MKAAGGILVVSRRVRGGAFRNMVSGTHVWAFRPQCHIVGRKKLRTGHGGTGSHLG